jgi:D-glycero-D-manno-heptose 1,7-bisphosphate phosphatase
MSDKAIFLDRDETLIEDPGYISNPDQVKLLDGVAEALVELKALGYKLIIVTNQSAVARGIVTEKTLTEIHDRLKQLLAEKGATLDAVYYCPYHPEGVVPKYRKESNCRKPGPGMLLRAADEMDIDLDESWCIGNSGRDVEAGLRAGCRTILIDVPSHQEHAGGRMAMVGVNPDYRAVNIREVVNIIKKYHRSPADEQAKAQLTSAAQTQEAPPAGQPAGEVAEPVLQAQVQQPESESQEPPTESPEQEGAARTTEELLCDILRQLKSMQRTEMFGEFSIMRLMAGVVQIVVLFCLLIAIWLLMGPNRQDNSIFIALGFAIALQLMALTFYTMRGRK